MGKFWDKTKVYLATKSTAIGDNISNRWSRIKLYFTAINYDALGNNIGEVAWLTGLAFLPLFINILIGSISTNSFLEAVKAKIIPGEILSYTLSFIAPSLYLLVKTHGTNYRLPLLKFVSFITITIYFFTAFLLLIAKNKWVDGIDGDHHEIDLYFKLSLLFLIVTIILRIYSTYHGSYSNWSTDREQDQDNFDEDFINRIPN